MQKYRRALQKVRSYFTLDTGVILVAALISITWVWSTISAIQRNFQLQQQLDSLAQDVAIIELENKNLEFQKKYFNSDEYLELSAREHLGKASPGEKLLLLPPNTTKTTAQANRQIAAAALPDDSNFAQWMYFLFGKKG